MNDHSKCPLYQGESKFFCGIMNSSESIYMSFTISMQAKL